MQKKGFTLVEVVVVVAILGILAVGVIISIDPIELMNRASDSTTLSLARDFTSAANQFQTNRLYSAACADGECVSYVDSLSTSSTVALSTLTTVNSSLVNAGATTEATTFTSHRQASQIQVSLTTVDQPKDTVFVLCWLPKSKQQKAEAQTSNPNSAIYNSRGIAQSQSACPANSTNTCYRCLWQ